MSLLPDDMNFLVGRKLVEVSAKPVDKGGHRYRATPLGWGARAVDVTTIRTRAQVLVPGIREKVQPPTPPAPRRRALDTLSGS